MAIWTPSASAKIKTKKLKEEGCKKIIEVEVPEARLAEATHNVFLRLQLKARIPGFRKGKAPLSMIKQQYAHHAEHEAVEELIKMVIPEVMKENDLRPVSLPQVDKVRGLAGSPVKFELHVETAPKVSPKDYKGIKLTKTLYEVKEADIDERLKQLQDGNARLDVSKAEAVGGEHYVVVDFEMSRDGKPIEGGKGKQELVDMSSDQTVEGLTQGLLGAKRGEERTLEVKVQDKPASCRITVHEIKEKILPVLDDAFSKDLGFDTLDALRKKLSELIEKEYAQKSDRELQLQLEKALLDANKFPVPESLTEQQLRYMLERFSRQFGGSSANFPAEQFKELGEKMRPDAERSVRMQFLMAEIAKKENLEATDEDLKADLEKHLASAENEKEKKEARELFEKRGDDLRAMIRERKTFEFIRGAAKVAEKKN